jgi:5-methyltetrahydropteroyltriglutamate--homocysteine methyltransferase
MSTRTSPPFRADHVGSLLRPAKLHTARADRAAGKITAAGLRAVEDEAIRAAVAREVGLQSATDGEFRRATWHMDFVYQIGGISKVAGQMLSTFHNPDGDITYTPDAIRVDRRVTMDKTIFGDDFAFLQSIAGDLVPKLTIPAPSMVHYRSSTSPSIRIPRSSGPTCPRPTPRRSAGSPSRAAATCSSTTRRSPT